jgi:SAM-dependent methyltransferase
MTHEHDQHRHHHHGDGQTEVVMDQAIWDERYRSSGALWSGNPNPHLVSEASDLSPGTALDVGCGEGADAIWLANRGWVVTAVDFSNTALERGAARAVEEGAEVAERITWLYADLTAWAPKTGSFDLVSVQFMHLPKDQRDPLYRRLAESVTPGGTLLVVGHHPSDLQTTVPRPRSREFLFTSSDIAPLLDPDGWNTIVSAERARQVTDPEGHSVTIHDTVLRAARRL